MEIEHFSHRHPLIQTEVLETDGEKGVICSGTCHSLVHTYSLGQVKELLDNVFCRLCYKKINPNYAAYYCQECDYVAHTVCTYNVYVQDGPLKEGKEDESRLEEINLKGDEEAGEIKHFSHQHNLVLNCEELKDKKLCEGCTLLISGPFYSCEQCSFFLHDKCAKLPTKKKHPLHPHQLTLFLRDQCVFRCHACDQHRPGFSYKCEDCRFNLDVQCCTLPEELKHEGHQHSLFLAIRSEQRCNGCHVSWSSRERFVCTECKFAMCFRCATLPLMIKHKYNKHPLKLTYAVENDSEEYFCVLCEKERNPKHWFYYCAECDFDAHTECVLGRLPYIKWGSPYMYQFHEHPLTYVPKAKYSPTCKSCGVLSKDWFLECDQCKATVWRRHICNS
ncbi:hypothetical protein CJ030_MR1G028867 [Morella rubra]|uniref:Phorbol-ester/DAG-type domain-containing protein n=1 Tax=Morella rubra TaxID=262757 RepID=A0A6A1WQB6_9ROSI|nr:hypothetical protein CJ030_MR1G028867 [Morella rubra]